MSSRGVFPIYQQALRLTPITGWTISRSLFQKCPQRKSQRWRNAHPHLIFSLERKLSRSLGLGDDMRWTIPSPAGAGEGGRSPGEGSWVITVHGVEGGRHTLWLLVFKPAKFRHKAAARALIGDQKRTISLAPKLSCTINSNRPAFREGCNKFLSLFHGISAVMLLRNARARARALELSNLWSTGQVLLDSQSGFYPCPSVPIRGSINFGLRLCLATNMTGVCPRNHADRKALTAN